MTDLAIIGYVAVLFALILGLEFIARNERRKW